MASDDDSLHACGHVLVARSGRYLLVALCVTCFYSLLTALTSLKLIISGSSPTKTLFLVLLLHVAQSETASLPSVLDFAECFLSGAR